MERIFEPLDITPEQRANLEQLWEASPSTEERLPMDMAVFVSVIDEGWRFYFLPDDAVEVPCGSTACMLGRGPACGIPAETTESWGHYAVRVFGCQEWTPAWDWLFSPIWKDTDNTLEGARKRPRIALDQGVPYNSNRQMHGQEPLMYEVRA